MTRPFPRCSAHHPPRVRGHGVSLSGRCTADLGTITTMRSGTVTHARDESLRSGLEDATREAVMEYMHGRYGPDMPPMHWRIATRTDRLGLSGHAYDDDTPDSTTSAIDRWAQALGIGDDTRSIDRAGILVVSGTVDGLPVDVWGVVDHEAWRAYKAGWRARIA